LLCFVVKQLLGALVYVVLYVTASLPSGSAESKISGKLPKKAIGPREITVRVHFTFTKVDIMRTLKILLCQINGPAAAGSGGPIPTPVNRL